jgi:hypothetical protein
MSEIELCFCQLNSTSIRLSFLSGTTCFTTCVPSSGLDVRLRITLALLTTRTDWTPTLKKRIQQRPSGSFDCGKWYCHQIIWQTSQLRKRNGLFMVQLRQQELNSSFQNIRKYVATVSLFSVSSDLWNGDDKVAVWYGPAKRSSTYFTLRLVQILLTCWWVSSA